MSEEKKVDAVEQVKTETPTPKEEPKVDPAIYTQADVQKMLEKARKSEREIAFQDFEKEIEEKRAEAEKVEKEQKRSSLIEQIDGDEKLKGFFGEIDENYGEKSLDWLNGVMKSHSIKKQEHELKNTAKPIGAQSVSKSGDLASFFDKKFKEMQGGGK